MVWAFVLITKSLTAAQLTAITAIMVAARIFDALNDPIMGNIIERTRTKWGKFKPWLLAGILTSSAVVIAAFNNSGITGWSFIVYFGIMYFLYSITFTMSDISYWGMVPALGSDGNTRNMFTSRATLFAGIGGTLASVLIPMLTTGGMAIGGNAVTAYGVVAIVICILSPLFAMFTLFGVKENRSDMSNPAPKISFKRRQPLQHRHRQLGGWRLRQRSHPPNARDYLDSRRTPWKICPQPQHARHHLQHWCP